jgi:ribosome production factor 1
MPTTSLASIKNKIKRKEISRKTKKSKCQHKLQKRLTRAKVEASDPAVKKVSCVHSLLQKLTSGKTRLAENIPRTLDNTRESDPSALKVDPSEKYNGSEATDPFSSYFSSAADPTIPPRVLITTSPKATRATYEFCDELVGVFPGAEFIRRKRGKGFETGRIAGWAADRGYKHMCVVNEDMRKPSEPLTRIPIDTHRLRRRRDHSSISSKRTNRILQAYLRRIDKEDLCKRSCLILCTGAFIISGPRSCYTP